MKELGYNKMGLSLANPIISGLNQGLGCVKARFSKENAHHNEGRVNVISKNNSMDNCPSEKCFFGKMLASRKA